MKIFDLEFEVPPDFRVEGQSSAGERSHVDIIGPNAWDLAATLAAQAMAAGFERIKQESTRITLERGEQALVLVQDSGNLVVHVRDPTVLPRARFEGSAVLLNDLRIELGATAVEPLRERYLPEQRMRSAAWKLTGVTAPQLIDRVLDTAVVEKGLKRGAVFGPAKGGMAVWGGEAYSSLEFLKVHAVSESDHVLLEMDLVDKREELPTKTDPG